MNKKLNPSTLEFQLNVAHRHHQAQLPYLQKEKVTHDLQGLLQGYEILIVIFFAAEESSNFTSPTFNAPALSTRPLPVPNFKAMLFSGREAPPKAILRTFRKVGEHLLYWIFDHVSKAYR